MFVMAQNYCMKNNSSTIICVGQAMKPWDGKGEQEKGYFHKNGKYFFLLVISSENIILQAGTS